ncbi:hypothetical protein M408DRAFT_327728 [Serendipita vermifera MAFF 305830]|uniref:Uncharacterized protein n=1 Tax=Serendipita vermifera MAFF 305830 TaxID=933852 RepID=A0A0C3B1L7_SERVB|nr:hypothetical protein M408DRAFT_327728 [Serendipita vermifera MAFF 305830]
MPLLSRTLDPLLGVFTGVLAFQLRQNHPRTAPPDDERLTSLIGWKLDMWKEARRQREAEAEKEVWASLSNSK